MQLFIYNNQTKTLYSPPCLDDITIAYSRYGTAGKLSFTVLKRNMSSGEILDFHEGDYALLNKDNRTIFKGVIISKTRSEQEGEIHVTAVDQLFYLVKNKHFMAYENKTLTDVVKIIAQEFQIKTGELEISNYVIPQRIEENKTLMDIICYAIDATLINRGDLFVLYDDAGSLTLKNTGKLIMPYDRYFITSNNSESFDYNSSIESDTFNRVIVYRENKETKNKEFFPAQDQTNINKWGILQTVEKAEDSENPTIKAQQILNVKNKVKRKLSIKNAIGNIDIKCGMWIFVWLYIGDEVLKNYFMVESVTHHIEHNNYTMDLNLINRDFSAGGT